ncbi:GNAT family N-acetyltransferase [Deinococcus sp.]|uniref:GNAT family N-acetyltransferase n=1 Tax=Deinococcus sp. TaxID=47478 RepID=UPI003CC6AE5C
MKLTLELEATLLARRQAEWAHWRAHPDLNPLLSGPMLSGEVSLKNDLCIYTQNAAFSDGLPYSGIIVTRRPCETVFDLTPDEVADTHALLTQVRAHLDATVQPDGYTLGWNVFPAGGAHIPHVHLHVIPRWNTDAAAGAGLRWFLKAAAQALSIRPAVGDDLPAIRSLILTTGLSSDPTLITATLAGCSYWLAVQHGQTFGCIGLEHGEGASLLRSACVLPDFQRRGIGARLADTALGAARGRGDRAVYLFSSHAGGYWQRLGFVQVPVTELSAALPNVPQVRSGLERGWIRGETAWKLDLSG